MKTTTLGTVRINDHTIELPEAEARTLFLAAAALTKRPGALVINADTTLAITSATQVSITIPDGFTDEYNPDEALEKALRGRPAVVL